MIKKIINSKSQNYFCILVIGNTFKNNLKKYTLKYFKEYCKKNDIGLFIITEDLISRDSLYWKKPEWQKFLAPKLILDKYKKIKNICMIDNDILINTSSPNIFKFHKKNSISVVSIRNNMPYEWDKTTRKIAFLRKKYYSKSFPLDSALNISTKNLYKFHKLEPQLDEFCAGVYILPKIYFEKFYRYFFNFKKNIKTITNGGEQTHFNHFVQTNFKINLLNYKFQALWVYEMANYYPFLYSKKYNNNKYLISVCIDSSLINNYFLHFAGSWYEGDMWKQKIKNNFFGENYNFEFKKYMKIKLKGTPLGKISPSKKK